MFFVLISKNFYARDYSKDVYRYQDDGLYFFNSELSLDRYYPRDCVRRGIDVSKWQGDIDWEKVREAGIEFAIIRDGYGRKDENQIDKFFHKNIKEAQENGIKCGVYHYSYARNEEEAGLEADFCMENIKPYKLEYPIAFDIEEKSLIPLGREKLTDICCAFCDRIRSKGYYVIIYTNLNWVRNFLVSDILFSTYDLWLARYKVSQPRYSCGAWQQTSSGNVRGINGNVDCDMSYFDYPKIMEELNLNGF